MSGLHPVPSDKIKPTPSTMCWWPACHTCHWTHWSTVFCWGRFSILHTQFLLQFVWPGCTLLVLRLTPHVLWLLHRHPEPCWCLGWSEQELLGHRKESVSAASIFCDMPRPLRSRMPTCRWVTQREKIASTSMQAPGGYMHLLEIH